MQNDADADAKTGQSDPVHGAVSAPAAVDACVGGRASRGRADHGLHGTARLSAGTYGQDHVRARAVRLARHVRLRADRRLELRAARLPPPAGRCFRQGRRAHRRRLHAAGARHRLAVGQAHVGRLLGVGPAADLRADALPALPRADRAALVHRGRGAGRQADRRAEPRRHRHPAGHQVLGELEQPASACERDAARRRRPSTRRCCGRCW